MKDTAAERVGMNYEYQRDAGECLIPGSSKKGNPDL